MSSFTLPSEGAARTYVTLELSYPVDKPSGRPPCSMISSCTRFFREDSGLNHCHHIIAVILAEIETFNESFVTPIYNFCCNLKSSVDQHMDRPSCWSKFSSQCAGAFNLSEIPTSGASRHANFSIDLRLTTKPAFNNPFD